MPFWQTFQTNKAELRRTALQPDIDQSRLVNEPAAIGRIGTAKRRGKKTARAVGAAILSQAEQGTRQAAQEAGGARHPPLSQSEVSRRQIKCGTIKKVNSRDNCVAVVSAKSAARLKTLQIAAAVDVGGGDGRRPLGPGFRLGFSTIELGQLPV